MTSTEPIGALEFTTIVESPGHLNLPDHVAHVLVPGREVRVFVVFEQRDLGNRQVLFTGTTWRVCEPMETTSTVEHDMAEGYAALAKEHLEDAEFYLQAQSEVALRAR